MVCTVTEKTECDRDDCLFMSVSAVRRLALPRRMCSKMVSGLGTDTSSRPLTATPPLPSSMSGCFGAFAFANSTDPSTRSETARRSVISSLYSSKNVHLTLCSTPLALRCAKMCDMARGMTPALDGMASAKDEELSEDDASSQSW